MWSLKYNEQFSECTVLFVITLQLFCPQQLSIVYQRIAN